MRGAVFGNKKTVPRLRDGWVSTFLASTHSPQTGLAKVKPIARLNRGDVLMDWLHFEETLADSTVLVNDTVDSAVP
jgi:hypothetical protein